LYSLSSATPRGMASGSLNMEFAIQHRRLLSQLASQYEEDLQSFLDSVDACQQLPGERSNETDAYSPFFSGSPSGVMVNGEIAKIDLPVMKEDVHISSATTSATSIMPRDSAVSNGGRTRPRPLFAGTGSAAQKSVIMEDRITRDGSKPSLIRSVSPNLQSGDSAHGNDLSAKGQSGCLSPRERKLTPSSHDFTDFADHLFELWPAWQGEIPTPLARTASAEDLSQASRLSLAFARHHRRHSSIKHGEIAVPHGEVGHHQRRWHLNSCWRTRLIMPPSCWQRLVWDMASLLALVWDMITIPLMVFDFDELQVAYVMRLATVVFWTMDIGMSLCTGYYDGSTVELKFSKICQRYVRTWMTPDFLVASLDWSLLLWGTQQGGIVKVARVTKTFRFVRLLRVLRLARVMKVASLFEELTTYVVSDMMVMAMGITRLFCFLVLFNHYIACGWYAVSKSGPYEESWMAKAQDEYSYRYDGNVKSKPVSIVHWYLMCFHWSLAQFTPAPNNQHPKCFAERAYAVFVILFGIIYFSSFLGSITSLIASIRQKTNEKTKNQDLARRFINENHVSLELGARITCFLKQQQFRQRSCVLEKDVTSLKSLPELTLTELHSEVYAPLLMAHPFFYQLADCSADFMITISHNAVQDVSLMPNGQLFAVGADAPGMYVLKSGAAVYYSDASESQAFKIKPSQNLSEAALWVQWRYTGKLFAVKSCLFIALNTVEFHKCARKDYFAWALCQNYAKLFVEKVLNNESQLDPCPDHFVDLAEIAELANEVFETPKEKADSKTRFSLNPHLGFTHSHWLRLTKHF